MMIQELLKDAFEAGVRHGRKPYSHVDRNAIDFKEWLKKNTLKIYFAIEEFNQEQKKQRDLDSY